MFGTTNRLSVIPSWGGGIISETLDATEVLRLDGLRPNPALLVNAKRCILWTQRFRALKDNIVWFFFFGVTWPIRSALGLRSSVMGHSPES